MARCLARSVYPLSLSTAAPKCAVYIFWRGVSGIYEDLILNIYMQNGVYFVDFMTDVSTVEFFNKNIHIIVAVK